MLLVIYFVKKLKEKGNIMSILSDEKIKEELSNMDGWIFKDNQVSKSYNFDKYMDGIKFVNVLARVAEEVNHHPDLVVGWCKVSVSFTSHDQGGVTSDCISMAKNVDKL